MARFSFDDVSAVWAEDPEELTGAVRHVCLVGIHSDRNTGRTRIPDRKVTVLDRSGTRSDEYGNWITHPYSVSNGVSKPRKFRKLADAKHYAESIAFASWKNDFEYGVYS